MAAFTESFGPDLAFDGSKPERENYQDVILAGRLQEALLRLMRGEVRV
jgi:type I restriction enzyme R subunit